MTTRERHDSRVGGVDDEVDQPRRRRIWSILAVVVALLLLSLCSWCLFWPVPQQQVTSAQSVGGSPGGGIRVSVDEAVEADGDVGSKGRPVVVRFTITNRGAARSLTPSCVKLQIDRVLVPPMDGIPHDPGLPVVIQANSTVQASAVFAVPNGATEATLSVNPPNVEPDGAGVARLSLVDLAEAKP